MTDYRPEIAEAIGVFFLVLGGGSAILLDADTFSLGPVGVSLAFAFVITVLVYALGHICGAHFNPALTIAFATTGHFPWRRVPTYVGAQIFGATIAALVLRHIFGTVDAATTVVGPISDLAAFGIEALATFLLALVIIGVATDRRAAPGAAGLAIGLTVGVDALAFGGLTGASMNPARTLGPALAAGMMPNILVYFVAPIVGACAAMATYEFLRRGTRPLPTPGPLGVLGRFHLEKEA